MDAESNIMQWQGVYSTTMNREPLRQGDDRFSQRDGSFLTGRRLYRWCGGSTGSATPSRSRRRPTTRSPTPSRSSPLTGSTCSATTAWRSTARRRPAWPAPRGFCWMAREMASRGAISLRLSGSRSSLVRTFRSLAPNAHRSTGPAQMRRTPSGTDRQHRPRRAGLTDSPCRP